MTTPTSDISTQVDAVAKELRLLMRKKKGRVKVASFPALTRTRRVQREAKRLRVGLSNGDELRAVLRVILQALADQERAVKAAHFQGDGEDEHYLPNAGPAIALLGLTPRTESTTLRKRQAIAMRARSKDLRPRTMRNDTHEPLIAREIAVHLIAATPHHDGNESGGLALKPDRSEALAGTRDSPQLRLWRDAVTLVASYGEFYNALRSLRDTLHGFGRYPDLVDEAEFFVCLYALSKRGFKNDGFPLIFSTIVRSTERSPRSRYSWIARILAVLDWPGDTCLGFQLREAKLLEYACSQADGNLHVFLQIVEDTRVGTQLLDQWSKQFQPRSYRPLEFSKTHVLWMNGLGAAQHLISPKELTKEVQMAIAQWVLENGHDSDVEWLTDLMDFDDKTPLIDDSAKDRAFLRSIIAVDE